MIFKKAILIFVLSAISFGLFAAGYEPQGKEEFIFAPYYYSKKSWASEERDLFYSDRFLYGGFYKTLEDAISDQYYSYGRIGSYIHFGLWYWDYVLRKGYFDDLLTTDNDGKALPNDADYYTVVLDNGERYIYKSLKIEKYTPKLNGSFVINPIANYTPLL